MNSSRIKKEDTELLLVTYVPQNLNKNDSKNITGRK